MDIWGKKTIKPEIDIEISQWVETTKFTNNDKK